MKENSQWDSKYLKEMKNSGRPIIPISRLKSLKLPKITQAQADMLLYGRVFSKEINNKP